jgi:hypothetical protein
VSDGEGVSWARRPVYDWEKPYYPNYHEDMDMDTIDDVRVRLHDDDWLYWVSKYRAQLDDYRTILGEVRRMLEEGTDYTGIIGYIDESLTRIRR